MKVIDCECGYVIRGASDDELVAAAYKHMRAAHPEVGTIPRAQLLAMAETVD
jgi:predicted small metal-binding protein